MIKQRKLKRATYLKIYLNIYKPKFYILVKSQLTRGRKLNKHSGFKTIQRYFS